jgi:hypothetical protein
MLNGIAPEASMTFVAGTLDNWQITFYLSLLSNSGSSTVLTETLSSTQSLAQAQAVAQTTLTASLSTAVTSALANPAVQAAIGNDWTVVWGPEVYVEGPDLDSQTATSAGFTTSNAVFVAHSPYPFTSPALTVQHEEFAWRHESGITRPVLILWVYDAQGAR